MNKFFTIILIIIVTILVYTNAINILNNLQFNIILSLLIVIYISYLLYKHTYKWKIDYNQVEISKYEAKKLEHLYKKLKQINGSNEIIKIILDDLNKIKDNNINKISSPTTIYNLIKNNTDNKNKILNTIKKFSSDKDENINNYLYNILLASRI